MQLQYRRYRLPLRVPIRTAREVWTEREGMILCLQDESGQRGWGEVAPIPAFGTESVDEAETRARQLGSAVTREQIAALPVGTPCLKNALLEACRDLERAADPPRTQSEDVYRAVAALLPAGRTALEFLPPRAEIGFRTFKWKVGVGDIRDELGIFDDLCGLLPGGAKLRLDANGGWDRREAERWLERCADRPVEFVEQPCFAGREATPGERARSDDVLRGLAADYPTPIALDESLVSAADVTHWTGAGWSGWYVVKPALLDDPDGALAVLAKANASVVFSSALETAVGAGAGLRRAFEWGGVPKALGYGVWPLFQDRRFDGPAAAPFIRRSDLARLTPESLWNALA